MINFFVRNFSSKLNKTILRSKNKKHLEFRKEGRRTVRVIQNYKSPLQSKFLPEIKQEFDKQINFYDSYEGKKEIMEKTDADSYLKNLDNTFEGFFFKREFTLENFNFYLQVLARQKMPEEAYKVLEKMKSIGITPSQESYNHVITAYSHSKDIKKVEEIFLEIKSIFKNVNKFTYNSLILVYAKNGKCIEAESIIREMKENNLNPDIVSYTTLIGAYRKANSFADCWRIFKDVTTHIQADEGILTVMIRICAATHDCEKALNLWTRMEGMGFRKSVLNYNAIIFALGSRKDFALRALQFYDEMKASLVTADNHTYVAVLRAASKLGDITTANNTISEMKLAGQPFTEHTYTCLLKTYAQACRFPYGKESYIEMYVKDSWEIFKQFLKLNLKVNNYVLNALLQVNIAADKIEDIDGLVLPLYDKYNVPMNVYTYEVLVRYFLDKRKLDVVEKLYYKVKEAGIAPNQLILNAFLDISMRKNNLSGILESLKLLRESNKEPHKAYLRTLGNLAEVPDELYLELMHWQKFGNMTKGTRTFKKPQYRERTRPLTKLSRQRGRRYQKNKY